MQDFLLPSRRTHLFQRLGLFCAALLLFAAGARAAPGDLATGLTGGTGVSYDDVHNHLYFVDFNAGALKRVKLTPDCEAGPPPACVVETVATGFVHPQGLAVHAELGVAYLTTRDDPGTTGALWRVDLTNGVRTLITFNLDAPQQIVLDPATNSAYTVGSSSGKLWRVNLSSGVHAAVATGLDKPVGLAVRADRTRAYVSEQVGAGGRLAEIDLATGARLRNVAVTPSPPFHLAWTDSTEITLYVAERGPGNRISRVDLPSSVLLPIATGLPPSPAGLAVNLPAGAIYVATDAKVVRLSTVALPMNEPVFLAVGDVPSTSIKDGYANTPAFKDAPFGGTLEILGNLPKLSQTQIGTKKASHYRVLVSKDGGASFSPLTLSWSAERWDAAASTYKPVTVAPALDPVTQKPTDRYRIETECVTNPQRCLPLLLLFRWPSSTDGKVQFKVELYSSVSDTQNLLPASTAGNNLTLQIDNTPPEVTIHAIRRHDTGEVFPACKIISAPVPNSFDFKVTASDPGHHLRSISLEALWGDNRSAPVWSSSYDPTKPGQVDTVGGKFWSGLTNAVVPLSGWAAKCNCAHTFFLTASKRTINGRDYILSKRVHQSLTINNVTSPTLCP